MFKAKIFTLYPEYFPGPFEIGICKKAFEKKLWDLKLINIRDYADDKHKTVDGTPYGGGVGMLMRPDVVAKSLDANLDEKETVYYLTPKGKIFNQDIAKDIVKKNKVNILCGHFEGVDQRVLDSRNVEEISIGDFILSGGEMASFVVLDTVLRLVPGVLGNLNSTKDESFENGLLEYPQYTKPVSYTHLTLPTKA